MELPQIENYDAIMRVKRMNGPLNLHGIYKHLEENALDYKYPHQIAALFQKIRDEMHEKGNTVEELKAQWEVDFFNFWIDNGIVKHKFTFTDGKGEELGYPSFDRFTDETYDYLTERLASTDNPFLQARYAHILWSSPRKHGKFALIAIDSYLKLVGLYERKDKEKPEEHYGLDVLQTIKNAYSLSLQINDSSKLDATKSEIKRLIFNFNPKSNSLFALRANLIELMLKGKRVFTKHDFADANKMCLRFAQELKVLGEIHKAITALELGEKIDNKTGEATCRWRREIARSYEELMKRNIGKNNSAALHFCQKAVIDYRKIQDSEKATELEKIYDELRTSTDFKEFRMEIDLEEYVRTCKKIAKKVAQESPERIIAFLMSDRKLLPRYNEMRAEAEKEMKEHPIQSIFPIVLTDERGHSVQHFSDEEEMLYYKILEKFKLYLENQHLPLINIIILEVLQEEKLTFDNMTQFFRMHSWFGKTLKRKLPNNQEIRYNWLSLIAPSLSEYFKQMKYHLASGIYPMLVTPIDSLTLKIEGLLRDICRFAGVTTSRLTQDSKGRNIAREKDIHALLHEEEIRKLFDEDDLLFFRFLLVEQAGYNLRHKIAHSLMVPQEYGIRYMHLLLLALLRLGKYDFVKKVDGNSAQI